MFENNKLQAYPNTINTNANAGTANVAVQYIKVPDDINWAYTVGNLGQFIYNANTPPTVDFELHNSEFTEACVSYINVRWYSYKRSSNSSSCVRSTTSRQSESKTIINELN